MGRLSLLLLLAAGLAAAPDAALTEQVRRTEIAFAKTMADRDLSGFESFLSKDAMFVGRSGVMRGPKAVAAGWRHYFEGAQAPFSWAPETVEVIESGTLALSSGPVRDPQGKRIGTFNSVWRREGSGWKIVIDHGCPPCDCGEK